MKNEINILIIEIGIILCGASFLLGWGLKPQPDIGALSVSGLPGVYNASGITVPDGSGAAIALDSSGRAKVSTSTTLNVNTP